VIEELSYNEVAELAYFGARILHSRMVQPLKERDIPLRVKNVYKPQVPGTRVHRVNQDLPPRIKAVTSIQGIALTSDRSGATNEVIAMVDQALLSIGVRADVMLAAQSSAQSFLCFVVPTSAGFEAVDTVMTVLRARLAEYRDVTPWTVQPVSIVTAIGDKIDQTPSLMGQIFTPLEGIRLLGIAQGPARCSVSLVVPPADAEVTLKRLHKLTAK
jgi:bifunctional aspartokinase / homoserine dehydrogenase 1